MGGGGGWMGMGVLNSLFNHKLVLIRDSSGILA